METKDNYPNKCSDDLCMNDEIKDSQEHLHCQKIENQSVTKLNLNSEDLFFNNVNKQQEIASIIKKRK